MILKSYLNFGLLINLFFIVFFNNFSQGQIINNNVIFNFKIDRFNFEKNITETTFEIINRSDKNFNPNNWELHWNQMKGSIIKESLPNGITFEYVNGEHYYKIYFGDNWKLDIGKRVSFKVNFQGIIDRKIMGPNGVFVVNNKIAFDIKLNTIWKNAEGIDLLDIPSSIELYDTYPNKIDNKSLNINLLPTPDLIIYGNDNQLPIKGWNLKIDPFFKEKTTLINQLLTSFFDVKIRTDKSDEYNLIIKRKIHLEKESYTLEINTKSIEISSSDIFGIRHAIQSLRQIKFFHKDNSIGLPTLKIEDSPRFTYRGFLLDISRHFYSKEKILQVLDVLSLLKLNYLELRLTDDEGWRIEIPDLPELTEIGAKRGYTENERDKLIPAYGSGANGLKNGNGFLSKNDFKDILVYANKLGIKVIPQISFPSHARSAIKAMETRYFNYMETGDIEKANEYLLTDFNDKSQYRSAQGYNDNIICICFESSYKFYHKVFSEVKAMYDEVNIKMEKFSIGADEVPFGAWKKSKVCQEKYGIDFNVNDLYLSNLKRLLTMIKERGVTMTGWEDILLVQSSQSQNEKNIRLEHFDYEPIPYVWNNTWGEGREDMIYKFANLGFKTVMSNSSAFYFDMSDNKDFENYGLNWSGYVDYFDTWAIDPLDIFSNQVLNSKHRLNQKYIDKTEKIKSENLNNFLGIQSQLWTETVIDNEVFDELFMPNIIVFSERAWGKRPKWILSKNFEDQKSKMILDWENFTSFIGGSFLPFITENFQIKYHLPKPGGKLMRNKLFLKTQFPGLKIRYTTDGSIPNMNSKVYSGPVVVKKRNDIYARSFDESGRGGLIIKIEQDGNY
ncbi:MAG: family 20 glycosylhydrolase [Bacteroidota bacterium]|nr:family 20 glycosylhydrolase [Bacteroidota bacterium]